MKKMILNEQLLVLFIPLIFGFQVSKAQTDPYNTLAMQKKAIIGTWINTGYNTDEIGDHNWTMKFTKDGKCYWYYTGDDVEVYTYTIVNYEPKDPYDYELHLINVEDIGEDYYYEMYIYRDINGNFDAMALQTGGKDSGVVQPSNFVFKKIKN